MPAKKGQEWPTMSGAVAPAAAKKKSNKINKICVESPAASAPGAPAAGGACDAVPPAQNRSGGCRVADPHDEMPIGKKGPSTFEELLERELARDGASAAAPAAKGAAKATFLRRGVGPARARPRLPRPAAVRRPCFATDIPRDRLRRERRCSEVPGRR